MPQLPSEGRAAGARRSVRSVCLYGGDVDRNVQHFVADTVIVDVRGLLARIAEWGLATQLTALTTAFVSR